MKHGLMMKAAALVACGALAAALGGPGCDMLGMGGGGSGGYGGGGYGGGGYGDGGDPFADLDPQELSNATLKASALSYYVAGLISSSGIDPSAVDQDTLDALVAQDVGAAEATVDDWLATVDASAIETGGNNPDYNCTDKYGCPYVRKCMNEPYKSTTHNCWVNTCGSAKCGGCPDWFPDWVKALYLKSWCGYVCTDQKYPETIVAVGIGGMTRWDTPYPSQGAYCVAP